MKESDKPRKRYKHWRDVLRPWAEFTDLKVVRRWFDKYLKELGKPLNRCAIEGCPFHEYEPIWLGKPLTLVLDHLDGDNRDNSPGNLRYLCPNCNSQQDTFSGRNKGRVLPGSRFDGGSILINRDGSRIAKATGCSLGIGGRLVASGAAVIAKPEP